MSSKKTKLLSSRSLNLLTCHPVQLVCEDRYTPKIDTLDTKHFNFNRQMFELSGTNKTKSFATKICDLRL